MKNPPKNFLYDQRKVCTSENKDGELNDTWRVWVVFLCFEAEEVCAEGGRPFMTMFRVGAFLVRIINGFHEWYSMVLLLLLVVGGDVSMKSWKGSLSDKILSREIWRGWERKHTSGLSCMSGSKAKQNDATDEQKMCWAHSCHQLSKRVDETG